MIGNIFQDYNLIEDEDLNKFIKVYETRVSKLTHNKNVGEII